MDPNDETEAEATVQFLLNGMRAFLVILIFSGICATTFFKWGETLPLEAWFPKNFAYGYEVVN